MCVGLVAAVAWEVNEAAVAWGGWHVELCDWGTRRRRDSGGGLGGWRVEAFNAGMRQWRLKAAVASGVNSGGFGGCSMDVGAGFEVLQ